MSISDFLLSEWLWNITWGMAQVPINVVLLALLLWCVQKVGAVQAFFTALLANAFSCAIFTAIVVGGIIWLMGVEYIHPEDAHQTTVLTNSLHVCLYLGLIHAVLQIIFFAFWRCFFDLSVIRATVLVVASNMLSALIVNLLFVRM